MYNNILNRHIKLPQKEVKKKEKEQSIRARAKVLSNSALNNFIFIFFRDTSSFNFGKAKTQNSRWK